MRKPAQARSRVLARALVRRLPRPQRDLIKTAGVLGDRRKVSVYLVGGPVRDLILGRPSADLDLTVVGDAIAYAKALGARLGTPATTHPRFGTATLMLRDGLRLDVATARREVYGHPAALPQVEPGAIEEDLFRRDFTVNAMAIRLARRDGDFLDPFGGLKDLEGGLLRVLHEQSYRDDPTRIFRGARYGARYRLRFSPRDRQLIGAVLAEKGLPRLSGDRLFREFKVLLGEARPEAALKILQDLGVLRALDPALVLDRNVVARVGRARRAWQRYQRRGVPVNPLGWRLNLLVLLLSVPAAVRRRVGGHLGVKDPLLDALIGELKALPRLHKQLDRRRLRATHLRHLLDQASGEICILLRTSTERRVRDRIDRYLGRLASMRPALTGHDLREFGFRPGPLYRRIMDLLLQKRLEGRLRRREDEIAFLRQRFGRPH